MNKFSVVAVIAMALMLVLTACGKPKTPVETMEPETSAAVPVTTQTAAEETEEAVVEETTEEEPWKVALAEDLFSKYGVLPEYYEDLGDGIYQVYVEVGGEIVPFVTVNSATGDYHG